MPSVRLFVYGSLRRGRENHVQLARARFLGATRTEPAYAPADLDGYPVLLVGQQEIEGELFELEPRELERLDVFEGPHYVRGEVRLADGSRAVAYLASELALARLVNVHGR